eukprot:GILI01041034.1.p1 GENE.GILI01041034.1~~GILI01041034.1.p1  ORF type:complete len:488 (-),score=33.38 GILI01041034.1:32-1495(-)
MRLRRSDWKKLLGLLALFLFAFNLRFWAKSVEVTSVELSETVPSFQRSSNHKVVTPGDSITEVVIMESLTRTSRPSIELAHVAIPFSKLSPDHKQLVVSDTRARCISKGMQSKCYFSNLMVQRNVFHVFGSAYKRDGVPNPIYPPDGQQGPLVQYHKYKGHPISELGIPHDLTNGNPHCDLYITRPTIFLYRMSGHSTYHLWENNLGPFFATLNEDFGLEGENKKALKDKLNDPSSLLVAYVDNKPTTGPKAPHLLSKLLQLFTNARLINASALDAKVCFIDAIVGISSHGFQHRELLFRMMESVAGYSPPGPLPPIPKVLFISRNHHSVVRGRKIANEAEVVEALNRTLLDAFPKEANGFLRLVHMEDYSFEDQIRMAMKTHIILSPHGGGVTNCIWMREGSVTVEFVAPVGKSLTNMYHTLCGKSGVSHFHFLADPDPADEGVDMKGNARLFSNMVVPPGRAVENLQKALRLYEQNREKALRKVE